MSDCHCKRAAKPLVRRQKRPDGSLHTVRLVTCLTCGGKMTMRQAKRAMERKYKRLRLSAARAR